MLKENPNITFNKDGTIDIQEPYIEQKKEEEKKERKVKEEDHYVKQSRLMDQYHEEAIRKGILPPTDIYTEENNNSKDDDDELMRKLNELVTQEEELNKQQEEEKMKRNRKCLFCDNPDPQYKCARCKTAYYCSKECQKADWKLHKRICKTQDINSKKLELPPPPAPHLIDDSGSSSAFNGKVIEHSLFQEGKNDIPIKKEVVEDEVEEPKRISKFKQRRMNKE